MSSGKNSLGEEGAQKMVSRMIASIGGCVPGG